MKGEKDIETTRTRHPVSTANEGILRILDGHTHDVLNKEGGLQRTLAIFIQDPPLQEKEADPSPPRIHNSEKNIRELPMDEYR